MERTIAMNKTVIQTKDLCKTYIVEKQSNNVLQNVNLNVEEGEFVSIMGPSGSGKSTLLYTVSGMDCRFYALFCQLRYERREHRYLLRSLRNR